MKELLGLISKDLAIFDLGVLEMGKLFYPGYVVLVVLVQSVLGRVEFDRILVVFA